MLNMIGSLLIKYEIVEECFGLGILMKKIVCDVYISIFYVIGYLYFFVCIC